MRVRAIAGMTTVVLAGAFGVGGSVIGAGAGTSSGTLHLIGTGGFDNQSVVVMGPISGHGTDQVVDDNHDVFVLQKGSLKVRHHTSSSHDDFDKKNCVFSHVETGTYTITGGTGAYSHAHGYGSYQAHFIGQGCDENKPPVESAAIIDASGPFTLG